jgi:hypothetical protein
MNQVILYLLWAILAIVIIIGVWITIGMLLPVHGQTPPANQAKTATPAAPAIAPTPVPEATPTSPAPNLQYLPQKAYVQSYAPEIGIPTPNTPLQAVPQVQTVQPVPVQQNTVGGFDIGSIMGYLAAIGSAGAYLKGHIVGKKADKNEEVTREQSQQIIKGTEVDQSIANQVYQNMADGGASIHDKPEIKLENLAKDREEAIKTATKA